MGQVVDVTQLQDNTLFGVRTQTSNKASAITQSTTNDIHGSTLSTSSVPCRAVYVGTTGNLSVVMANDNDGTFGTKVVFNNVPVGVFPIQVVAVHTDTTASDLVALF